MTNGLASGEARRSMAYPEVSNAEAPEVSNAECQSLASALDTSGYAVLRQAFDPAQAAAALAALSQPGGLLVRDAVWMRNSERIAQVLELDDIFGEILSLLPAEVATAAGRGRDVRGVDLPRSGDLGLAAPGGQKLVRWSADARFELPRRK